MSNILANNINPRSGNKITIGNVNTAVAIAGTLTYEDVTSIDSVGIITAQSGIHLDDSIVHLGDTNTKIRFPAADTITAETGGTERLRINSAGKVGIGTNNPGHNLHVYGSFPDFAISDSDTTNDKFRILHNGGGTQLQVDPNNVGPNASYFLVSVDATERLRITSDGKMGLGESSPDFKFHSKETGGSSIAGLFETNQTDSYISFQASGTTASSTVRIGAVADNFVAFVNGGERLRITSAGKIGIGNADPNAELSVNNASSNASVEITRGASGAEYGYRIFGADGSAQTALKFFPVSNGSLGSEVARFDASGRFLKSGQASLTSTSLSYPIQVACSSDAAAIAIFGRAADDIGELAFYEADKSTKLGELQYRQDHLNFRHRVGDIRFATGGVTERLRITSAGKVGVGEDTPASQVDIKGNVSSTTQFSGFDGLRIHNANGASHGITADMYFTVGTATANRGAAIGVEYATTNGNDLYFATNPNAITSNDTLVERLRIKSTGEIEYAGSLLTFANSGGTVIQTVQPGVSYKPLTVRGSAIVFGVGAGSAVERARITDDGITFNGDTAAANALDDYEEGTYTPYLMGSTGNPTYTVSTNRSQYVKIGRLVDVTIDMSINIGGQGSGDFFVTLPFIVENNASKSYSELTSHRNNSWFTEGEYRLGGYTLQNTNQGYPRYMTSSGGNESAITWVTHTNSGGVRIALRWMYYTAT